MNALKSVRRGRGGRRLWLAGATLLAVAAFGVVFVAASGAAPPTCPTPGNFEIDGDMLQQTCTPGADDWNTPNIGVQETNQGGTYSTAGKDGHDPSTWTSSGSTPDKTNFAREYATSRVVGGHFFVFVAWERTSFSGTQGYAIEITNAGTNVAADGTPQPSRGTGGVVFYISSQGSSPPAFNQACAYSSQSNYGTTCTTSNASVTSAINTALITDPLNGDFPVPAGGFFEVALDVTTLTGITPTCPGASAASVYLRSITGQTSNGNLKGYMAPLSVAPDSTCVPPPITTTATPGGSTAAIGSSQHDDVTVSDGTNAGVGSVKFFLCTPAQVTATGCDKPNGTQVGLAKTLNGSGQASSDSIDGTTTPNDNTPGKYCWRAEFTPNSGDHHFLAGSHTNSTTECFTVVAQPGVSTTVVQTPGAGGLGSTAHDTASITGTVNGFLPTGTVTYEFFSNGACTGSHTDQTVTLNANGTVPNSAETAALAAGSYGYKAVYSGDSNYLTATGDCEPFSVSRAQPGVSTTVVQTPGAGGLGSTAHDTASITGTVNGFLPTGTVTYEFFSNGACTGSHTDQTVTLNANGTVPNSAETAALAAGSYGYKAVYSGDSNYLTATGDCEPFSVSRAQPGVSTTVVQTPGAGGLGSTAHDTASITGTVNGFLPTGTVTYEFFSNGACTGSHTDQTVTLNANGTVPNSAETAALAAGSYGYKAVYSGDSNYLTATGDCEPFSVSRAQPGVSTTVVQTPGAGGLGSTAHDTASITGTVNGFLPTGTVTYEFFSNGACTGSHTDQTVTLNANGTVPNSAETAALAAGSYGYKAVYSGDSNYLTATGDCEPFSVSRAQPGVSTTVVQTPGAGGLGSTAHDTASITGTVNGFLPTGTVTYEFFSNGACTGSHTDQTVTLNANGTVPNSAETAALAAGSYGYKAVYSGDSNYLTATGDCEPFSVSRAQPGVSTTVFDAATNEAWTNTEQTGATAYDTATITGTVNGFLPTGTVTYEFFTTSTCTGPHSDQTVTLNANGTVPNSAKHGPLTAGGYSFQATYSGDGNYLGATGDCEPFSLGVPETQTSTTVFDAATDAAWLGTEKTGASAYDTASVSGQVGEIVPTGTVTYTFFTNGACSGDGSAAGTVTLNPDGSVPNSNTTDPLQAGDYSFQATYSGDDNYATSTGDCEPFSVAKGDSATSTTVFDAATDAAWLGTEKTGASAYDTASVSGQVGEIVPTGTVTYTFFTNGTCSGDGSAAGTVTLNPDGSVPNSNTTDPLQAGDYSFQATYSGDDNYATSTGDCEPFSVAKGDSATSTTVFDAATDAAWLGTEKTGASAYDTASVTPSDGFTATGTVDYTFFTNGDCSGEGSAAGSVTLDQQGNVPNSDTKGPLAAGDYSFQATYLGDDNYKGSTGDCEPFSVAKGDSATSTTVFDAATDAAWLGTEKTGASAYDTASVTPSDGFTATGTVDYTFFTNGDCSGEGSAAGSVTLDQQGNVPNSDTKGPLAAGDYSFQATYSGDDNYKGSTGDCEPFSVGKAPLTPSTTIKNAADDSTVDSVLPLGSKVYDTTQLAGAVEGFDPTGTVSYQFFQNGNCSGEGSSAGSDVALDGQSDTKGPLGAGDYSFQATYSGDSNYIGATSACEPLTIGKVTPSASTTLKDAATDATVENGSTLANGSSVYDTADISNAGGFPLSGTVSFRFFHNGDCSGTPASVQTGVAVGGHSAATGALDEGSYGFQAMYVAGDDSNHTDSAWSACEPFNIQGLVDLMVTKSGSPASQTLGDGNITWTIVVTNNGPDADTGAKITDPMPTGNTFVSVTTSKGTCTGGATLNCTIGDMAVGEQVTITLVTTPTAPGTQTNVVSVSGDKPESNTSNNQATATVEVGPFTPPKPCIAVSKVTPKQLFVGRKTKVTIHLTQGGKVVKGIHVRIKGPKIDIRTKASNSKGIVKQTLKMKKAGVLVFTPIASKACNTRRVGVTNVFTPPVTG